MALLEELEGYEPNREFRRAAKSVLGFDPFTDKEDVFIHQMTPERAKYILDYLNNENRKLVESQKAAIRKSVDDFGWLWDGGAVVFTTSGNLSEFQHRLCIIVEYKLTVDVIIVTGVKPDVFVQAAPAKNRSVTDAINKKDKTVTGDEVTTLRQVLKCESGEKDQKIGCDSLKMTNAVSLWEGRKENIRKGMSLTKKYFASNISETFKPWLRQFNAWAVLMVEAGHGDKVEPFLSLLENHQNKSDEKLLFTEMFVWVKDFTSLLSGAPKSAQI